MWSVNTSDAYTLITLTGLGVLFYIGIVFSAMSSYAFPLQTPVSLVSAVYRSFDAELSSLFAPNGRLHGFAEPETEASGRSFVANLHE